MRYGYARVSTRRQVKGNSLAEQRKQLMDSGCEEVIEEQYTGTTTERPQLEDLLMRLNAGDTLMVTKLDRLVRSATEGANLIKELTNKGIRVNILNMGEVDERPQGRLMLHILLAFAEFERDMIVERTQGGKAIARTKAGFREGRPPIAKARKDAAIKMVVSDGKSYKEATEATGISKSTIVRAVRKYRLSSSQIRS
ncbi:MAG: recombinase family protein [Selenomonas sp.]|nr:recombinase family protein [Selenomonas sp.]MBQ1613721.1 recombinase family protein [Selenomonas sp.]MBQ2137475.1 recombinase family protein [Selenomonas sp.]MBQ4211854.1 recombinase family protein [Selenomonas sp.]MBQ5502601.1 recombinase family protein [Selenomonas sp.]